MGNFTPISCWPAQICHDISLDTHWRAKRASVYPGGPHANFCEGARNFREFVHEDCLGTRQGPYNTGSCHAFFPVALNGIFSYRMIVLNHIEMADVMIDSFSSKRLAYGLLAFVDENFRW